MSIEERLKHLESCSWYDTITIIGLLINVIILYYLVLR